MKLEGAKDAVEKASSLLEETSREKEKAEAARDDAQTHVRQKAQEEKRLPDKRAAVEKLWDWVRGEQKRSEALREANQEAQRTEEQLQKWREREAEARRNHEEPERQVAELKERYEKEKELLAKHEEDQMSWREILAGHERWTESDEQKLKKWEDRKIKAEQELERTKASMEGNQVIIADLEDNRLEIESKEKELV